MDDMGTALSLLGLAFTVWAGVVAWGVRVIREEVSHIKVSSSATAGALQSHVTQTERRLTMLEAEWNWVKDRLKRDLT